MNLSGGTWRGGHPTSQIWCLSIRFILKTKQIWILQQNQTLFFSSDMWLPNGGGVGGGRGLAHAGVSELWVVQTAAATLSRRYLRVRCTAVLSCINSSGAAVVLHFVLSFTQSTSASRPVWWRRSQSIQEKTWTSTEHGRFTPRRTTRSSSGPWVRKLSNSPPPSECQSDLVVGSLNSLTSFPTELPEDVIKMAKDIKPVTEIKQNGNDFVITSKTPGKTVTNAFTIGKEAEITTMDGKKLKVCPTPPTLPGKVQVIEDDVQ